MQRSALSATCPTGFAVSVDNVSKKFFQKQRTGRARDIFKNFIRPETKEVQALSGVSLTVRPGEFLAYAGANGAGKSTTIKLLGGMLAPDSGSVTALGYSPMRERIPYMRRAGILFGNRTELWWDHPVAASFDWKRVVWDIPQDRYRGKVKKLTELLDLGPLMGTFARELSLGQRMRCDLAMALLHGPELVLLDEPTLGLDVSAKRRMIEFLKLLNKEDGVTIVVTSHDMDDLEEMARRIVLLSAGNKVFDGDFSQFRRFMGCTRQVRVTTQSAFPPALPGTEYVSSEEGQHLFLVPENIGVRELLARLADVEGICDVEFIQAPLEQAVAALYERLAAG